MYTLTFVILTGSSEGIIFQFRTTIKKKVMHTHVQYISKQSKCTISVFSGVLDEIIVKF